MSSTILNIDLDVHYLNEVRLIHSLGALHPQGFWGRGFDRNTPVLAPSVFTQSKWTVRPLAFTELLSWLICSPYLDLS